MAAPDVLRGPVSARLVMRIVADFRGVAPSHLAGPRRDRHIAWPRQEVCWILQQRTAMSLPMIGRAMGGRDHSTILHGINAVRRRRRDDADYRDDTDRLLDLVDRRIAEAQAAPPETVRATAERVILDPGSASRGDVLRLAGGILAVAAVQISPDVTDPEARLACRQMLAGAAGPAFSETPDTGERS